MLYDLVTFKVIMLRATYNKPFSIPSPKKPSPDRTYSGCHNMSALRSVCHHLHDLSSQSVLILRMQCKFVENKPVVVEDVSKVAIRKAKT
jgi:hypothetical protein